MNLAQGPSPEATETPQVMEQLEQESPAQQDASLELGAQTPTSSPESTEPEPALPVLRPGKGKKITKTEIPDSESLSEFSSPEKTIVVGAGKHDAGASSFAAAAAEPDDADSDTPDPDGDVSDAVAPEEEARDEIQVAGEGAMKEGAEGDGESGVEVTSIAPELEEVLTAPVEVSEVENAVDAAMMLDAVSTPEAEISKSEEDGESGVEIGSGEKGSQEPPMPSIEENKAVDASVVIDTTSMPEPEPDISKPEEVPIDQAPVILQVEEVAVKSLPVSDGTVKEDAPTIVRTSHGINGTDYSNFKVPGLKKILQERELAVYGNKLDLIARLKEDDEASVATEREDEALKEESSPASSNEAAQESVTHPTNEDAEMSETPAARADDRDIVMVDEVATQTRGLVESDSSSPADGVSEKGQDKPIAPEKASFGQRYLIPDSDDEELPDAPSPVEEAVDAKPEAEAASTNLVMSTKSVYHDDPESNFSLTPTTTAKKALELLPSSSQASEVAVEDTLKMPPPPSHSHPQNSAVFSPVKTRVSPNPSFKAPSPVKKTQTQSPSAMMPCSPSKPEPPALITSAEVADKSATSTGVGPQGLQKDGVMSELKALKIASIQARITSLQAEIAIKRAKRDELQRGLLQPATETVKRHIKLLHDYNDIKDIGQGLVGMIADQRGLRVGELYEEFGVDLKD